MGLLGIPTRTNKMKQSDNGSFIHYKRNNYSNPDAVENLIHYITRTRVNEDRAQDLLAYGAAGAGYYLHPDDMIQQFLYVQNIYGINRRGGKRMYHEVFNLYDCEAIELNCDPIQLGQVGMECCQIYFQMGFQAVFAVHWEAGKRYHFHFAVNSINFIDGRKWHTSIPEIQQREKIFNQILWERQKAFNSVYMPLYFLDDPQPVLTV